MTLQFIQFTFIDFLDIVLVAFIIYLFYDLIKGTVAIQIFLGILSIYLLWKLVTALQMEMLGEILGQFIGVGVIALLIVFQPELRQFLLFIGNRNILQQKKSRLFRRFFKSEEDSEKKDYTPIIKACEKMARTKTGALIVIARESDPSIFIKSSHKVDGMLTANLLEAIFFKNNPLHDGAVLIRGNRIVSARGVLPVSESEEIDSELGMRHRAALGITESTDAMAIIVSEETGRIAYSLRGKLFLNITRDDLLNALEEHGL
jgi:uncharacterized protein (TIGR00159 family)